MLQSLLHTGYAPTTALKVLRLSRGLEKIAGTFFREHPDRFNSPAANDAKLAATHSRQQPVSPSGWKCRYTNPLFFLPGLWCLAHDTASGEALLTVRMYTDKKEQITHYRVHMSVQIQPCYQLQEGGACLMRHTFAVPWQPQQPVQAGYQLQAFQLAPFRGDCRARISESLTGPSDSPVQNALSLTFDLSLEAYALIKNRFARGIEIGHLMYQLQPGHQQLQSGLKARVPVVLKVKRTERLPLLSDRLLTQQN